MRAELRTTTQPPHPTPPSHPPYFSTARTQRRWSSWSTWQWPTWPTSCLCPSGSTTTSHTRGPLDDGCASSAFTSSTSTCTPPLPSWWAPCSWKQKFFQSLAASFADSKSPFQFTFFPPLAGSHVTLCLFLFSHHQVCISAQRCVFLLHPFYAKRWRRRYEVLISLIVWVLVGLGCSPFILMRSSSSESSSSSLSLASNVPSNSDFPFTQGPLGFTRLGPTPLLTVKSLATAATAAPSGCFKDLPMRQLSIGLALTMIALAELFGFVIPLFCISYSSIRITRSLRQGLAQDQQQQATSSARCRLQSVSSSGGKPERCNERMSDTEKRRALRMVLGCFMLFVVCFVPYHVNFLLYLMVSQGVVSQCAMVASVRRFHPVSLCLASLSSCLNPLLYYFLTVEFRQHLSRRVSSITSSLLSSPSSSSHGRRLAPQRLMSMESSCSDREDHH